MEQNRIKERLLKMYALATNGVDGEKETAQKILEANLAKYGLTIDDLVESNEKKKIYWFTAKDKYQRMLLGQIYCVFVCKTMQYSTYTRADRKYDVGLEMTEVEAIAQTIVNKMQTEIGTDVKTVMSNNTIRDDFKYMMRKMTEEILKKVK